MTKQVHYGEVWLANLNPSKGNEPGKNRPVLVIQSDYLNLIGHPTTIALPISSQIKESNKLRIPLEIQGLKKRSFILVDQIRSLDVEKRMIEKLGEAPIDIMHEISKILSLVLGL